MGISCIAELQRGQAAGFPLKPICSAGTRRVAGARMFTTSCSAGKCWGYASVKEKMIEEYKKSIKCGLEEY